MLEIIETIRPAIDLGMVVLIWLVQLVIYPSFRFADPNRFVDWHHSYMQRVSYVVMPLMLTQALCIGITCFLQPDLGTLFSAVCMLVAWIVTFTYSVPCHNQLQNAGNASEWIERLIKTNWIRTIAWTLVLVGNLF